MFAFMWCNCENKLMIGLECEFILTLKAIGDINFICKMIRTIFI